MKHRWKSFLIVFAIAGAAAPKLLAQGQAAAVARIASEAGVELRPKPHMMGTELLTLPSDPARPSAMISPGEGSIYVQQLNEENEYWLQRTEDTPALRDKSWAPDFSSLAAYRRSLQQHRQDLRRMLGLLPEAKFGARAQERVLEQDSFRVEDVTIPIAAGFGAKALLIVPMGSVSGAVIAIPDATVSREEFLGLKEGQSAAPWLEKLLGRRIAVAVPVMTERTTDYPFGAQWGINRRQLIYRLGFVVGRTLVGLEVQQTLAVRNYLARRLQLKDARIGLLGTGQGGMTALYAAGVDGQFGPVDILNYFQQRENCWNEPVDRMLYGQLNEFGDAEVADLIAPGPLTIFTSADGGIAQASVEAEAKRTRRYYGGLKQTGALAVKEASNRDDGLRSAAEDLDRRLGQGEGDAEAVISKRFSEQQINSTRNAQFESLHAYVQQLDRESDQVRASYWKLDSVTPNTSIAKAAQLRAALSQLMGKIPTERGPLDAYTRLILVSDKFIAYDVFLEVLPGVHAYGQLLVPRNQRGRLAVVICQHGLGGRPTDITGIGPRPEEGTYHNLGLHLANLGYVVFAPYLTVPVRQELLVNPLVREAAAVGMMRTSLELAKLHRIVDFLQSLPFVDGNRIGYYGLSYGGYSAIWMPPLEPRIKLNVISGHFNDWRTKITDEKSSESYLRYQDADFYNWNVLNRFSHVELVAAMAPRAVCVEFGQHDPTTTPLWHARAWMQVEAWKKAAGLGGLTEKVVEARYEGIHEIHGIETLAFLNRWLRPNLPDARDHSYNLLPANIEMQAFSGGGDLATGQGAELPLLRHPLDGNAGSWIRGRFYVSGNSTRLGGIALKLSRIGMPGALIVRFGTTAGGDDLGRAVIEPSAVRPLFDLWYTARIPPVSLDPSKLYYFEVRAASGEQPNNNFIVYGPRPLGGRDEPGQFGLSYRILGAGASSAAWHPYERFGFMQQMLADYVSGVGIHAVDGGPERPGEIPVRRNWSIRTAGNADEVVTTAGGDLQQFFEHAFHLRLAMSQSEKSFQIVVQVTDHIPGVNTEEGYRVSASARNITIEGATSRGVMRGVYTLEDWLRAREGAFVKPGVIVRNMRFGPRITTAVHPGLSLYRETSFALPYTDGLLQRISHSGFNALWVWLNTEEATMDSKVYPELDDREAGARLERLEDLARRARRYGIDVYIYLATGYNHHIAPSFFEHHPDARGYGWGPPLCTSDPEVRRYYTETVETIFHRAPDLKGMEVIYDSEGFWYCGNSELTRLKCPRCRHFTQQQLAVQLLTTLDDAMHAAGGADKQLIAWNYNVKSQWVLKLIPLLPRDIIIQADFDKGMIAEKEGIQNETEDYNISNLGPPQLFVDEYRAAREHGLRVMAKTEHAVSQEFIFVPYIPCLGQQYDRMAKMREYDLVGWFGNWNHYGYTPSPPAELINRASFDPSAEEAPMLRELATENFGPAAAPLVVQAWDDYSRGIREFPYSDPVARTPGPIQKGVSQPLFLDPAIGGFGQWRSWQNDLNWTRPWGTEMTQKYLTRLDRWYSLGNAELEKAEQMAPGNRDALQGEWRVGRTIQGSVESVLHLIQWIEMRDRFFAAASDQERQKYADQLAQIALTERANAEAILPLLDSDPRLGYAAVGDGGLFTPGLVRWKLGEIDDVLLRQLPATLYQRNHAIKNAALSTDATNSSSSVVHPRRSKPPIGAATF